MYGITQEYYIGRIGRMNGKHLALFMSAAYFAIGFSPITALAIAIIGVLPLPDRPGIVVPGL